MCQLAFKTGWSLEYILEMPFKAFFDVLEAINPDSDKKTVRVDKKGLQARIDEIKEIDKKIKRGEVNTRRSQD